MLVVDTVAYGEREVQMPVEDDADEDSNDDDDDVEGNSFANERE